MKAKESISRRSTLKGIGAIGAAPFLAKPAYGRLFAGVSGKELDNQSDIRQTIFTKVFSTPLIDTHEHLIEESWLSLDRAVELTDPIMHGNARTIFNLTEKTKRLKKVSWSV